MQKAELSGHADFRDNQGGSSVQSMYYTFTRKQSAPR